MACHALHWCLFLNKEQSNVIQLSHEKQNIRTKNGRERKKRGLSDNCIDCALAVSYIPITSDALRRVLLDIQCGRGKEEDEEDEEKRGRENNLI
jgi:hypothetical protein